MKYTLNSLLTITAGLAFLIAPLRADMVSVDDFHVPDDLEVTVWATSPMLFNPTNMDTDRYGRIWVTEGVNYRRTRTRPEGDRIVVLEDKDLNGIAESSTVFIQDTELISPLGISVFDNKIVVAQPPHILVYTDVDKNLRFDPDNDTRESLISGFNGRNHDHSLHATIAGPDGKWYINQGNCGAQVTDRDGRTFYFGGPYYNKGAGSPEWFNDTRSYAGKPSADGNIYQAGFIGRMNPDGSALQIIGHGFRNSYEHCISSLGDVFQNDNDDPPASRNTWLMEGGNLGFFSKDGTRTWRADRRPGQSVAVAEWRQEDPGSLPAGDVYGPGSPTGIAFYEHGALSEHYEGMLLSCEARTRVIQRYHPYLSKTGSPIELGTRQHLIECENDTWFRPSDIMVGADGALYLADWYDPGVGGHRAADLNHFGTIYRIAPKGFQPQIQSRENNPVEDAISLLKSPATHVRYTGFEHLKSLGSQAYEAVSELLNSENRWYVARAVWLLPYLGDKGIATCRNRMQHNEPEQRLLAFRALRAAGHDVFEMAATMVNDPSPAVRRELAVSLRDLDADKKLPFAIRLFEQFDGHDRHYLEACGLAAEDIESQVWKHLARKASSDPLEWSRAFTWTTWRLYPETAVPAVKKRALSKELPEQTRKFAMETLAFTGGKEAVDTIVELAEESGDLGDHSLWWLLNRGLDDWQKYGVQTILKEKGIYDPETIVITPVTVPEPPETKLPPAKELAELKGNINAGRVHATRCFMCHKIGQQGIDYGPALDGWISDQGKESFFNAVIHPSQSIAHGYHGSTVWLEEGGLIDGIIYNEGDPVVIVSTAGVQQMVPKSRIKRIQRRRPKSLMLSADQLGLGAQDLVDLAAFLIHHDKQGSTDDQVKNPFD